MPASVVSFPSAVRQIFVFTHSFRSFFFSPLSCSSSHAKWFPGFPVCGTGVRPQDHWIMAHTCTGNRRGYLPLTGTYENKTAHRNAQEHCRTHQLSLMHTHTHTHTHTQSYKTEKCAQCSQHLIQKLTRGRHTVEKQKHRISSE